ncbi:aryldialkylphosphatase [Microbacterium sp. NPDC076911]|uniref:phosphotriesterase family protein n=1 Tax=Microbacterium sp. NPDC076911 TaxID=3154958 RepID=UPI003421063D
MIRTVLGDIPADGLGATNYHEHLFQVSPLLPGDELDDEGASQAEAALLRASGFDAMVDATPIGLGRRPAAIARISQHTGIHVVATTGRHREAHYAPGHWVRTWDDGALLARFVDDIEQSMPVVDGQQNSSSAPMPEAAPVRAGMLKAGVDYWSISTFERQTLEAVAGASARTGVAVMVHLEFCTAAHEVLDILERAGTPAHRVVLAHADRDPDPGLHVDLAARGAYLGYDGFARPRTRGDAELLDLTAAVVDAGAGDRIVLGGDVARRSRYVSYGGMPGLGYLGERYLPRLRSLIGSALVERMLVENTARLLDIQR